MYTYIYISTFIDSRQNRIIWYHRFSQSKRHLLCDKWGVQLEKPNRTQHCHPLPPHTWHPRSEVLILLLRNDANIQEGDISSVFSTFSGRKSAPLSNHFRELKRNLTTGFEEEIQRSWDDLVETLKVRTEEVASKRESVCSSHHHIFLIGDHILKWADHSSTEVFWYSAW